MTGSTEETPAYKEVIAKRAEIAKQLFGLMVMHEWLGTLTVLLKEWNVSRSFVYHDVPDFSSNSERNSYHYIGCWEPRKIMSEALDRRLSDEEFVNMVTDVLEEELNKYNVELLLRTRHNWDGSDSVLWIAPKTN